MEDLSKYEQMRDEGISPRDACIAAQADGSDYMARIRLLRFAVD